MIFPGSPPFSSLWKTKRPAKNTGQVAPTIKGKLQTISATMNLCWLLGLIVQNESGWS